MSDREEDRGRRPIRMPGLEEGYAGFDREDDEEAEEGDDADPFVLEKERRRLLLERVKVFGVVAVALLFLVVMFAGPAFVTSRQDKDLDGAKEQTAVGTAAPVPAKPEEVRGAPNRLYTIRFNGGEYLYEFPAGTRVGGAVVVSYRVGRSGKVYVTGVTPAAPAEGAPRGRREVPGRGRKRP